MSLEIPPLNLVGCGILRKEIRHILSNSTLDLRQVYYDSALHCDLRKLEGVLKPTLEKYDPAQTLIFYGSCHPLMDEMLSQRQMQRTPGQNCVAMLLGHEEFMRELSQGSFFLLEEWAHRWREIVFKTMGTQKLALIREFYREHHQYLLALKTPCSGNYELEAQEAANLVGLPLRWREVDLSHLEQVLRNSLEKLQSAQAKLSPSHSS